MDRKTIEQKVRDALGVILVDKAEIHEDSTFADLVLDAQDVDDLFAELSKELTLEIPSFLRKKAIEHPASLSLAELIDTIAPTHPPQKPDHEEAHVDKKTAGKSRKRPGDSGGDKP